MFGLCRTRLSRRDGRMATLSRCSALDFTNMMSTGRNPHLNFMSFFVRVSRRIRYAYRVSPRATTHQHHVKALHQPATRLCPSARHAWQKQPPALRFGCAQVRITLHENYGCENRRHVLGSLRHAALHCVSNLFLASQGSRRGFVVANLHCSASSNLFSYSSAFARTDHLPI